MAAILKCFATDPADFAGGFYVQKPCLNMPEDQQFIRSLLQATSNGAVMMAIPALSFARITPNLTSALLHPDAVSAALAKEVSNGHTAGPFQTPPIPNLQCSPLGVVSKEDGTRHIIMDLSSPDGSSTNDYISKEKFSLYYTTFESRQHCA